jgi:hypothetical protein
MNPPRQPHMENTPELVPNQSPDSAQPNFPLRSAPEICVVGGFPLFESMNLGWLGSLGRSHKMWSRLVALAAARRIG